MARVPLRRQDDLPDEYQYLLGEDAMGEINLLCAMANNPQVLQSYMRYGSTLWAESGLNGVDVERVILAVARALDARYEWHQHVPIARDEGVPDEDIDAIGRGAIEELEDRHEAIVAYARAVATGDVDNAVFEAVTAYLDDHTVVGVTLLATHYLATARFLDALSVPTEGQFVGWELGCSPEN